MIWEERIKYKIDLEYLAQVTGATSFLETASVKEYELVTEQFGLTIFETVMGIAGIWGKKHVIKLKHKDHNSMPKESWSEVNKWTKV